MPNTMSLKVDEVLVSLDAAIKAPDTAAEIKETLEDSATVIRNYRIVLRRIMSERDIAISEVSRWATAAGEWQGKFDICSMAGVLEGWMSRAKEAEAKLARRR